MKFLFCSIWEDFMEQQTSLKKAIIYFNKVISLNPAKTVLDQVNILYQNE